VGVWKGVEGFVPRGTPLESPTADAFATFVTAHERRLRRALVASYGVEIGSDACAEALAWAWEHWAQVAEMGNPVGYLFRVGQSAARRQRRWRRAIGLPREHDAVDTGEVGVQLDDALDRLPPRQRAVAILVHAYGYSYAEVSDMTGMSVASVRTELHRAMTRLRKRLESR
jgi:RNA polymerase sigma factor (sigma-70 family)